MSRPVRAFPPQNVGDDSFAAQEHPARIPDGEYLAICKSVHHDKDSRVYGERFYLTFKTFDEGEYAGIPLRMFLTPSTFHTSNFYRAWSIAHGGPPERKDRMSPRIFTGKVFRVLTATVKPRHRMPGPDGRLRPGPFVPEFLWYSKIACLLELTITNERIESPRFLPKPSSNPFPDLQVTEGGVGSKELEARSLVPSSDLGPVVEAQRDEKTSQLTNAPEGGTSPATSLALDEDLELRRRAEDQKRRLAEWLAKERGA